ncbi:MAG TPA: DUF4345 family protein, partial [Hyphomonadaceae bacterium]|nr:DUF4345 family protein [Hyphomonadaceae bacterium]
MPWPVVAAIVACVLGGLLGLYALLNPRWASRLVRLKPADGKVEGKSEFRATYGGLFLAGHAFAGWALTQGVQGHYAAGALGACWLGTCAGRLISFALDKTATG